MNKYAATIAATLITTPAIAVTTNFIHEHEPKLGAPVVQTFYAGTQVSHAATMDQQFCIQGNVMPTTYHYADDQSGISKPTFLAKNHDPSGFMLTQDKKTNAITINFDLKAKPQNDVTLTLEDGSILTFSKADLAAEENIFLDQNHKHFDTVHNALKNGETIILNWEGEFGPVEQSAKIDTSLNAAALNECLTTEQSYATTHDTMRSITIKIPSDDPEFKIGSFYSPNEFDNLGPVAIASYVGTADILKITGGVTFQNTASIGFQKLGTEFKPDSFAVKGCFMGSAASGAIMSSSMDTNMPGQRPTQPGCANDEKEFKVAFSENGETATWKEAFDLSAMIPGNGQDAIFYNPDLANSSIPGFGGDHSITGLGDSNSINGGTSSIGDYIVNDTTGDVITVGDCSVFNSTISGDLNLCTSDDDVIIINPDPDTPDPVTPGTVTPVPVPPAALLYLTGALFLETRRRDKSIVKNAFKSAIDQAKPFLSNQWKGLQQAAQNISQKVHDIRDNLTAASKNQNFHPPMNDIG